MTARNSIRSKLDDNSWIDLLVRYLSAIENYFYRLFVKKQAQWNDKRVNVNKEKIYEKKKKKDRLKLLKSEYRSFIKIWTIK